MLNIFKKISNIKNKISNKIIYFIILTGTLFSNPAFAATPPATASDPVYSFWSAPGRDSELDMIAALSYALIYFIGAILAITLFIKAVSRLLKHGKNPQDPKNSIGGAVVMFIAVGLLTNLHSTIGIMNATLTGNPGHCMMYSDVIDTETADMFETGADTKCFDASTSELTADMRANLTTGGKADAIESLMKKLNILFGILQAVGLAYFVKGIYTLKSIVENTSQQTYGQVFTILVMSSLVIDMPNTLLMITETAKKIASVT
jgi:hypothetical protein